MRIHIFQHAHFEGPGNITDILKDRNHEITKTMLHEKFILPNTEDFDFLIIMGAPMSVNDEHKFPWLIEEKKFIKNSIEIGKKVLGICFGSQLIAQALGAEVYPNNQKEIGWFNINKVQHSNSKLLSIFDSKLMAFHWHGDTYDIPTGAKPIFNTPATPNQGFTYGDNIVGLQFHWEIKKENARDLIKYSGKDITDGEFIQTVDQILSYEDGFKTNYKHMETLLRYFDKQSK